MLNPKFEYRNPKQIQYSNIKCSNRFVSNFVLWSLEFVSYFVLRISDFLHFIAYISSLFPVPVRSSFGCSYAALCIV
jgi:hypothetical protein